MFIIGNFVCYLTNDFLSNPVPYSTCTLLALYTVADPTVIICVKSFIKKVPSHYAVRDTEVICCFHYKQLLSYIGEACYVDMP